MTPENASLAGGSRDPFKEDRSGQRHRHRVRPLEWLTVAHATLFLIGATWAFGGQADWVRGPLTAWGAIGGVITLSALLRGDTDTKPAYRLLWWGAPVLAFNVLVLAAAANPSFRAVREGAETLLVSSGGNSHWPSSARPSLARRALWEFDVTWLSCFNIAFVLRRRRAVRILLAIVALNALVLAVFGTIQKLAHAPGLFFGAVPSPQKYFFASFVYHNHWGAFALLMLGTTLALSAHYVRRRQSRDFFHSPAFLGLVVVLILATTIPLSASRSCTVLAAIFLTGAFLHWSIRLIRARRQFNESMAPPFVAAAAAVILGGAAIWYVAGDTISKRVVLTEQQVNHARTSRRMDARVELYTNTWQMARAKPWFGWGMASYPYVFTLYNTRQSVDGFPVYYHDAHSDWLQAVAEHGIIGAALLALAALLPLASIRRHLLASPLPAYVLAGCGLVLLYAWLEFPFGNYAIVLTWWFCWFSAVQYSRLTAAKAVTRDV